MSNEFAPTTSASVPPTCTCADGVVCDNCASSQIEASSAGFVELQPGMLTSDQQAGYVSVVAGVASWLGSLGGGQ